MERTHYQQTFIVVALAIGVIGLIAGFCCLAATYGRTWQLDYNAKITELLICSGLDQASETPILMTQPLTRGAREINICAHLEGTGSNIPLSIIWEYNGKAIADQENGRFEPGYITARLAAPKDGFKAGAYLVMIYLYREKLAELEFTVQR